jgi:DNA transformation protein and related proteins
VPRAGEVRAQNRANRAGAEDSELEFRTGSFHSSSMPHSNEYLQYVLEQLAGLRGVVSRRMFGGAGLYQDELFFALVSADTLYFKVSDDNRADYEARGMNRFRPYKDRPQVSLTYYEVPADVLEDPQQLVAWARRSLQAAATSKATKPKRKRKRRAGI